MNHSRLMALLLGGASFVCFDADGGGAADAGGGGGGGGLAAAAAAVVAANDGQQQDQQQQQQPQNGGWQPPKDLPDQFKGATADEVLGKLLPAYTGMRDKIATAPKAPETPDGYSFTPTEDIKGYFGSDLAKDPALAAARTAAHKHGIPQQAFEGFINDVFGTLAKDGALAAPYSPASEIKAYGDGSGLDAKSVVAQMTENEAFADGLIKQLAIPAKLAAAAEAELKGLIDTAGGQALLRGLMARLSANGIHVAGDGGGQGGPLSEADLKKLDADPRIDPANTHNTDPAKRFDPELRKRYDDGYAALGRKKYGAGGMG